MFTSLRRLVGARPDAGARSFSIGEDVRLYAIGDVHGRHDLLCALILAIIADHRARPPVEHFRLVMLGDLIDRGDESAAVVDMCVGMSDLWSGFHCLMGNHEEVMLESLRGDRAALALFRRIGRETMLSYGIDAALIGDGEDGDGADDETLVAALLHHVPQRHRDFLADMPPSLVVGDYLFVHAGIRPKRALDRQDPREMRWIRDLFLNSRAAHSHMVVHGHSVTEQPDEQPNRIGIDTGAWASHRLTAIGLQGAERWFLTT